MRLRLQRAIYIAAALIWAGVLLDWALRGFKDGASGLLARLYAVSDKIGEVAGEVAAIIVLLCLFGAVLRGLLALVVVAIAAVHGYRSIARRDATGGKGGH